MLAARAFSMTDLEPLLQLQHASAGAAPRWSVEQLAGQLTDPGRDGGRRVIIVADGPAVRAAAGYVPAGREFFVAPSFAADGQAADLLFAELERRATGADFVRASATPAEDDKRLALERRGYRATFAFVTMVRALSGADAAEDAPTLAGLHRVPVADLPLEVMRDAHNAAFRGVPNAPEQDLDEVGHTVAALDRDASGAWLDLAGAMAGYVWILRESDSRGPHGLVDAVGVAAAHRQKGLGKRMLDHALGRLAASGVPEVRALIASTNVSSLALHRALGFTEGWRRDVLQRDLRGDSR